MRVLDFTEGVQSSLEKVKLATQEVLMPLEEVFFVLQKDLGIHKGIPTGSNTSSEGSRGPGGLVAIEKVLKVVEEVLGVLKEVLVIHLEILCIVSGVSRSPGGYWSSVRVLDFIEGV